MTEYTGLSGPYTSPLANYYASFGSGGQAYSSPNTATGPALAGLAPNLQGKFPANNAVNPAWAPGTQASQRAFSKQGIPGGAGSKEAAKEFLVRQTYGILDESRASNEALFGVQEGLVARAADERVRGVDLALQETDRAANQGYQRARDFATTAAGGADLDAISSGLFNSSERFNAQRAVQGDVFRQFLAVDSAYANTRAELQQQRGQASAMGLENMANFYERVRATNEQSLIYEFDARLGRGGSARATPDQDNNGWAEALGTIITVLALL